MVWFLDKRIYNIITVWLFSIFKWTVFKTAIIKLLPFGNIFYTILVFITRLHYTYNGCDINTGFELLLDIVNHYCNNIIRTQQLILIYNHCYKYSLINES